MGKNKNKHPSSLRWAIWTVYEMKCFWCKKLLEFTQCEVARVIPESTSKIVLGQIIKDYGLDADFDLNEISNFVPACSNCWRNKSKFRPSPAVPSWFNLIRNKIPSIEAKIRRIEGDEQSESLLKQLVEKVERGEIKAEDAERILKPFLQAVEGTPKSTVEYRMSDMVSFKHNQDGVQMRSPSEMRYQKFVEGMVESPEFKRRSVEQFREGPNFGEGARRRPGSGA